MEVGGQPRALAASTPGKDPVPTVQEAGWAPGPVWTGEKSRPHGIQSRIVQPVVSRYTDLATRLTVTEVKATISVSFSPYEASMQAEVGKFVPLPYLHLRK